MSAKRSALALLLVLGIGESCTNDFDKFEVEGGGTSSSSGGQLNLAGTLPKAGTTSNRAGSTSNMSGASSVGGAAEGGMPGMPEAGTTGLPSSAGAGGAEPVPCGGPCILDHAVAACVEDTCAVDQCDADWGDCNDDAADGCEHSVVGDTAHCGECDRACSASNVAALECNVAACSSSCAVGFANCSQTALPDDGCETPVLTDGANCGGCDNACPNGFVCLAGSCSCNAKNDCGAGNGVECVGSLCECDQVACRPGERCRDQQGDKLCSCNGGTGPGCAPNEFCCEGDGCTDVMSNAQSCGACGRACTTGFSCSGGACQCDDAQDCGAAPEPPAGEGGAAATGDAGAAAVSAGAGGAPPTPAIACVVGSCVCSGTTCGKGQRCLSDGSCG